MSGDSKKRLIFSIYTKVEEDKGFACDWTDPVNKGQKYRL